MLNAETLYEDVVNSLARRVEDFRLAHMPNATYINWDAHAEIEELPSGDLIGLAGVGMAEDEAGIYEIVFGVMIGTEQDENLHRLTRCMSRLRALFVPETRMTVYTVSDDGLSAVPDSWMVTKTPMAITPVSRAEVRPVQALEVRALLDPSALASR